jgi:hypothetical protein
MKKIFFLIILFSLLFNAAYKAEAQSLSTTQPTESTYKTSDLPQWAKDFRRFDIIAFGIFPFSMFFVTTVTDMIRWGNANNFSFSEEGRRYAPWPLKSAGAAEMSNDEFKKTIYLAAGLSVGLALIDLLIVNIKRTNERKRTENLPSGSYEINITPYGTEADNSAGSEKK